MPKQIFRTIYTSSTEDSVTDDELASILEASRRNNAHRQITGALAYHDNMFIQILEGPQEAIEDLLAKISADPRHGSVMVLDRSLVDERIFPRWSMGWLRAADVTRAGFDVEVLQLRDTPSTKVNIMLKVFREIARLN